MAYYDIKWHDERIVYSKVEAKNKNEAIKKLLEGNLNHEYDWCGSGEPDSLDDIETIVKIDKKTFDELTTITPF